FKRSFDARKPILSAVYIVDVTLADPAREAEILARLADHPHIAPTPDMVWRPPVQPPPTVPMRPVVVGFGPCGIFAALVLAQMGFKPIVLERGRAVRQRTKDTWGLWRKNVLNPESNVQFGEGGAGTFSDGKLYSQIKDPRHLGRKVMNEFVKAGAPADILYEAHPHIGTFKLVKVVENMREQIIALGGEIRFEQRVTDVLIEAGPGGKHIRGLTVLDQATGETHELRADHVVMALGHSSRDTFAMLHKRGVYIEAKPFSIGFRVEHPQGIIDRARWGRHAGHPALGAAEYKLVHHASNGRSVYSFCMCPGGTVVAATSEPQRVVTNGMSQYSRNERNANAGMVVGI
ncbi:MAG: NAD(P)/FAD-dependent oxidoreductase, partial [Solimonas sp.]